MHKPPDQSVHWTQRTNWYFYLISSETKNDKYQSNKVILFNSSSSESTTYTSIATQMTTSCTYLWIQSLCSALGMCQEDQGQNFLLTYFLNSDKTEVIVIGPKYLRETLSDQIVTLDGISLAPSSTVRNLGVMSDKNTSFDPHLKTISRTM